MINRFVIKRSLIIAVLALAGTACNGGGQSTVPQAANGAVPPARQAPASKHNVRYQLIDLGTLGGPNSTVPEAFLEINGLTAVQSISAQGAAIAIADTATPDPFCYFDDCFYPNGIEYRGGSVTSLGALPNSPWSSANSMSQNGLIAGTSENGTLDPLTGLPELRAVIWRAGQITDLGTIDGGYNSAGFAVNNAGVVAGYATTTVPDPFLGYQQLAIRSRNGVMQDLGNLGGPDAIALLVNEAGQIAGASLTSSIPSNNPCLPGNPPLHPFSWENGKITDIGTFGGDCGMVNALNNRGQVVGQAYKTGDTVARAFVWRAGVLQDLGTLGGSNASAEWVNDGGDIVGYADLPGSGSCNGASCVHHAFLYRHGKMTDLGTFGTDPCSRAVGINAEGQTVGGSAAICGGAFTHAILWERGGPPIDLNTVIAPGADLNLIQALAINNSAVISGNGLLSNGDLHAFVLVPCSKSCSELHLGKASTIPWSRAQTERILSDQRSRRFSWYRGRHFGIP